MAEKEDEDDPPKPPPFRFETWMKDIIEKPPPLERDEADEPDSPTEDTIRALVLDVLSAYDYHCAMTWGTVDQLAEKLPEVEVTPIRPLSDGGVLHATNFIVLTANAARAFRLGHITIWSDFRLVVDLSTVDPELVDRLNPDGRLILPSRNVPDPEALRWHREALFASSIFSS